MATVAFITESEAKHRMPYAEAIRDVARIEAAHVVDDGDDGLLGVIGSKLVGRHTSWKACSRRFARIWRSCHGWPPTRRP